MTFLITGFLFIVLPVLLITAAVRGIRRDRARGNK